MVIRQIRDLAQLRVPATRVRSRQTLQIAGEQLPPSCPLSAMKRLERSTEFPSPLPPSNVRDGKRGPSTGSWFSLVKLSNGYGCHAVNASTASTAKSSVVGRHRSDQRLSTSHFFQF